MQPADNAMQENEVLNKNWWIKKKMSKNLLEDGRIVKTKNWLKVCREIAREQRLKKKKRIKNDIFF